LKNKIIIKQNRMTNEQHFSKGRKITGWILTGLIGAMIVMAGTMKLIGGQEMAEGFAKYGLGGRQILIGTGELLSAILFIIPRTSSLGVLLLSGLMGGAIVTHMEHGEMFFVQSIILVAIWITGWLRNPEMFSSFTKK
jgi:hypothetical protein